jgi:hypothetical protein
MVPLLTPVAQKLGIDLIWFGVLLAVNMQTSFLHPPFGFALFYLRSVAPKSVKTSDIYWGAIPFVVIQALMVTTIIVFPNMVTSNVTEAATVKGTGEEELRRQLGDPVPGTAESGQAPAPQGESKSGEESEIERALREGKSSDDSTSEIERALKGQK